MRNRVIKFKSLLGPADHVKAPAAVHPVFSSSVMLESRGKVCRGKRKCWKLRGLAIHRYRLGGGTIFSQKLETKNHHPPYRSIESEKNHDPPICG